MPPPAGPAAGPLTWPPSAPPSSRPSKTHRSAGLPLNWTGGLASDIVEIFGASSNTTGTGANEVSTGAEFICITTAGQGTFTVPASILTQLPASAAGSLFVSSGNNSATFTAPLKAGGSIEITLLMS